jgi:hypothetical protein
MLKWLLSRLARQHVPQTSEVTYHTYLRVAPTGTVAREAMTTVCMDLRTHCGRRQ